MHTSLIARFVWIVPLALWSCGGISQTIKAASPISNTASSTVRVSPNVKPPFPDDIRSATLKTTLLLGQESVKLSETMSEVPQWARDYERDAEVLDASFANSKGLVGRSLLLRLITSAVDSHPSILSKKADLAANHKGVESARWQYFPNLSVSTERGASPSSMSTSTSNNTVIRLQQTLWAGGRIETGLWISQLKTLSAQASLAEAQQTIALRVLDAWQTLLSAHGRLLSAQKSLIQLGKLDEMMTRRVAQDVSPRVDAELLKARLLQAQADQVSYLTAYRSALQRLEQLLGDDIDLNQELQTNILLQSLKEGQTRHLESFMYQQFLGAVEQHPSLLKLEAELGIAKAEVTLKQSELWPTVYARVERQYVKTLTSTSRSSDSNAYVGLQWSTGAGLSLRSQIEAAKIKLEGLMNDRETSKRDLQERLGNEWRDYLSATQRVQQNALVRSSQVGLLDSYTRLFVTGRRSWIELLNAVRELAQAEQAVTDLQAQVHASAIRLRVLAGDLPWQN